MKCAHAHEYVAAALVKANLVCASKRAQVIGNSKVPCKMERNSMYSFHLRGNQNRTNQQNRRQSMLRHDTTAALSDRSIREAVIEDIRSAFRCLNGRDLADRKEERHLLSYIKNYIAHPRLKSLMKRLQWDTSRNVTVSTAIQPLFDGLENNPPTTFFLCIQVRPGSMPPDPTDLFQEIQIWHKP